MKKLGFAFFLLIGFHLSAQQFGTLKIYLSPPPATIVIDGVELKLGNTADLKPGKYFVQAWAPNMVILDTILEVKAGEITSFFYHFQTSPEFLAQQDILNQYSNKRATKLAIPVTSTIVLAGALAFTYIKGVDAREEALASYDAYKYSNTNIDGLAADYENARSKYQGYVVAYYIEWGAMAISSYYLYKGIQWARKNKEPKFNNPKNPLVFNGLGMARDNFGNYVVGMKFNLGR